MVIFCADTAIDFYRSKTFLPDCLSLSKRDAERVLEEASGVPTEEDLALLDFLGLMQAGLPGSKVHVLVGQSSSRRSSNRIVCHLWRGKVKAGMLIKLNPRVAIVSLEFALFQQARFLPLGRTVQLAMEFCGCYRLGKTPRPSLASPLPLTSKDSLAQFAQGREGEPGIARFRQALNYIEENSWSPMETNVYILLCFPRSHGGYGLPKPVMNLEVDIPAGFASVDGRRSFYCDMLWQQARLCVEYDGDTDSEKGHFSHYGKIRDDHKRNALLDLGISVLTISKTDVYNEYKMDEFAGVVARRLSVRHRKPSSKMLQKRAELREQLLS